MNSERKRVEKKKMSARVVVYVYAYDFDRILRTHTH